MKVTITLEDCPEGCAVSYEFSEEFTLDSDACRKADLIADLMEGTSQQPVTQEQQEDAPRMVLTAEEINKRRAAQVAHLAPAQQIIYAH